MIKYSSDNSCAFSAALLCQKLREHLCGIIASITGHTVAPGDISLYSPYAECSTAVALKYGLNATVLAAEIKAKLPTLPKFKLLGAQVLDDAFAINGHVNIRLTDGFYVALIDRINLALTLPGLPHELTQAPYYALTRMLMLSRRPGGNWLDGARARRALWCALQACAAKTPDAGKTLIKRSMDCFLGIADAPPSDESPFCVADVCGCVTRLLGAAL